MKRREIRYALLHPDGRLGATFIDRPDGFLQQELMVKVTCTYDDGQKPRRKARKKTRKQ